MLYDKFKFYDVTIEPELHGKKKEENNDTYTGWLVTGGTSGKRVILSEKRSRKYRIEIFRLRLRFRENRL